MKLQFISRKLEKIGDVTQWNDTFVFIRKWFNWKFIFVRKYINIMSALFIWNSKLLLSHHTGCYTHKCTLTFALKTSGIARNQVYSSPLLMIKLSTVFNKHFFIIKRIKVTFLLWLTLAVHHLFTFHTQNQDP